MENIEDCPICRAQNQELYLTLKDFSVSGENFNINKCRECNFLFTNPRPSIIDIGKYYQSEDYISHSDSKAGLINQLYHIVRNITLKEKTGIINSLFSGKGKVLDVGCGTGYFLKKSKESGWEIKGTEPDEKARAIAEKNTHSVILGSIMELENEQFNVITLWHVLEHIHNLNQDFEKLLTSLTKDGKVIIAVPNNKAYDAQHYQNYWAAWDVPRHLYHFSPETMERFLDIHGLKIESKRPMRFDAFYVSLLSEKYKTGKQNLFKGFINGALSNIKAENINHSSIIYIAGRK